MEIFVDLLDRLPEKNAIAVGEMLNELSDDDYEFLKEKMELNQDVPNNIINSINKAFRIAGYPQFTWDNCMMDTGGKRFDGWFDEVNSSK